MSMETHRQMIQDRRAVNKFILETSFTVAKEFLGKEATSQNFLEIARHVANLCDNYPTNLYGQPSINDVMCLAFRQINYKLDMQDADISSQV